MQYVVIDASSIVGPFDTFGKAEQWCAAVKIDPKQHIRFLLEPEPYS
jgi:hypothetical protein